MTMSKTFHGLRRACGMVLFLVLITLPYVQIHGESALRFDIPSLRLLFFGTSIWMADFFIILIMVMFLTFFTLFATTLFGRIWCGWLCPQTVLVDATMFIETARLKGYAKVILSWITGLLVSAVAAAGLIGYFVSPYDLPGVLRTGGLPAQIVSVSFAVLVVLIVLDLIALRRRFCATVCPYAKMQGVLFDDRTLVVAFDHERADECMDCGACAKACPVNVDIRTGPHMACIHCAECVDACTERTAIRGRRSLVNYTFGIAANRRTGVRTFPLITGVLTVVSLAFLVYLAASRMPFDVTVQLNYTEAPINTINGSTTRSYMLSLRNMGPTDLLLDLSVAAASGEARVLPDTITLPRSGMVSKVPVSITVTQAPPAQDPVVVTLTVRSKVLGKSITRTIYFMMPENP
jgi:cytochrome c oxidase accessory protein FixG